MVSHRRHILRIRARNHHKHAAREREVLAHANGGGGKRVSPNDAHSPNIFTGFFLGFRFGR
jgi:hypothetical protein